MKILLSVAALLAMTAGSAIAQQNSALQPGDVWFLLQSKAVQNGLGLSNEVASKLDSLRADSRTALLTKYQEAGLNLREFPFRDSPEKLQKHQDLGKQNNEEFGQQGKELLTADQYQRLQQIHFQYRLRKTAETALLAPAVASELKLTDDQTQTLRDQLRKFSQSIPTFVGTNFQDHRDEYNAMAIDLLTAEQKVVLDKLKGNDVDLSSFFPKTTLFKRN